MTMGKARKPIATLDEVRALLREFPSADLEAASRAATREAVLTKPAGALGRLEEIAAWLGSWQARHPPRIERPRAGVLAGHPSGASQWREALAASAAP